jgi:hypothetical protein
VSNFDPNDRSVTGFRIRHGSARGPMSRALYYRLKKEGRGPREIRVTPTLIIITPEDEVAWHQQLAHPGDTEARLIAKVDARRLARAKKGAAASAASPRHVSKRKKKS